MGSFSIYGNIGQKLIISMCLKVTIILCLFAILINCASTTTTTHSLLEPKNDIEPSPQGAPIEDVSCNVKDSIGSSDSQGASIDQKIAQAEYLCSESKYHQADSILKEVMKIIDYESEADASWFPSEEYLETVLKVYTLMMPAEYIPEDIAIIQFKRQMLSSLDTMGNSAEDSILISKLICRKDISFDVPMAWNDRVKKALNYYLRSKPETISRWLQRAGVYLPKIKRMFADSGLPQDLAYLPLIESGFNPQAYSRAHASGMWQFISSTGKLYGLRHNYWLDERRDPIKSTVSAIKYLKKLHDDFGNWYLALAAYNCGEGGMSRAIARSGSTDYWQLPLPSETKNYVPCYLAAMTLAKNPDFFNFTYNLADTFALDTVSISECVDMKDLSDGINLDIETFRKINPQIVHWCTPPNISNVQIYVPQGYSQAFYDYCSQLPEDKKIKWYTYKVRKNDKIQTVAHRFKVSVDAIREINNLSKKSKIIAGRILLIPIPLSDKTNTSVASSNEEQVSEKQISTVETKKVSTTNTPRGTSIKYKVRKGDTISKIAELFDVSEAEIETWNNLTDSQIKGDQILVIYSQKQGNPTIGSVTSGSYKVQNGDTPYSIAKRFNISVDQLVQLNNLDKNNPVVHIDEALIVSTAGLHQPAGKSRCKTFTTPEAIQYSVSPGDNLYRIAQNFSVSLKDLLSLNNLSETSTLHTGERLLIPATDTKIQNKLNPSQNVVYYEVKQGDNLWSIAATFRISVQKLYQENNLKPDSVIMPGDTIKVIKTGGL